MKALSALIDLIDSGDAVVALGVLSLFSAAIVVSSVFLMGLSAG